MMRANETAPISSRATGDAARRPNAASPSAELRKAVLLSSRSDRTLNLLAPNLLPTTVEIVGPVGLPLPVPLQARTRSSFDGGDLAEMAAGSSSSSDGVGSSITRMLEPDRSCVSVPGDCPRFG